MARKITIFTGTRAEYGILNPLMKMLKNDPAFYLSLIVSGSHLSQAHGFTLHQILDDGWKPDFIIDLNLENDSPLGILSSMGKGFEPFGEALIAIQPDAIILLGDRYEALMMATAAYLLKIPIIHLHGGETTAGATDEAFRHSITKMAYWHFASAESYRKRIIQLGEHPDRVFTVGALGLDSIRLLPRLSETEIRDALGLLPSSPYIVATYHPETLHNQSALELTKEFYSALDSFPDLEVVLTLPNADAEGLGLIRYWEEVGRKDPRFHIFASLGSKRYFSAVAYAKAVIGNSSSGIIEVPSLGVPTINVGNRQQGRLMSSSIWQTSTDAPAIRKALEEVLIKEMPTLGPSLYGDGFTANRIMALLYAWPHTINLAKPFYDL